MAGVASVAGAGFISLWRARMIFAETLRLHEWCLSPTMVAAAAAANCGGAATWQRGSACARSVARPCIQIRAVDDPCRGQLEVACRVCCVGSTKNQKSYYMTLPDRYIFV